MSPTPRSDLNVHQQQQDQDLSAGSVAAPIDWTAEDAVAIVQAVRSGGVLAEQVVLQAKQAFERHNDVLNAIVTPTWDAAILQAQAVDQAVTRGDPDQLGVLAGVPVGIKDITPMAGVRTTYGSPLHAQDIAPIDAQIVAGLRRADALLVGKTNTPEFAAGAHTVNRVFGVTRNPWNPAFSPSGSTGGGAAAVAAGLIALAEGTDFGGSLRTPASFCGIVGLRPTPGLVPHHAPQMLWDTLSVGGPMARSARDCALMLDALSAWSPAQSRCSPLSRLAPWRAMAIDAPTPLLELVHAMPGLEVVNHPVLGPVGAAWTGPKGRGGEVKGPGDCPSSRRRLRIAWCEDLPGFGVEPVVRDRCDAAVQALAQAGADVVPLNFDAQGGRDAFIALRAAAMVAYHAPRLAQLDALNPVLAGNIRAGLSQSADAVGQAEMARAALWQRFAEVFGQFDLIATPTVPVRVFSIDEGVPTAIHGKPLQTYIDWIATTFLVSTVSLPAVSVPAGLDDRGLPVGLQLIGPQFSEPVLLGTAAQVQALVPLGACPIRG